MLEAAQTLEKLRFRQGARLGNYCIGRMLGQGAQGIVYLATDVLLQRQVALKVLCPIGHSGSDSRQLREARLIANLDHPNVVRVYHVGHNDQAFYMATEFVDGGNLKDLVRRQGPLRPERVLQLAAEAADALAHAHQIGVIHRDIKPQNFLIASNGSLKLCDFGLAFQVYLSDSSRKVRPVGTPQFMAPEIWGGHPASRASDLYSLGACIFFMLTGSAPYRSDNLAALERAHCRGGLTLPDTIPPMIQKVIRSCMATNPKERPEDASHLGRLIRQLLATQTGDLGTPSSHPPKIPEKRLEPNWVKAHKLALAWSPFCRQRDQLEDAARMGVPLVLLQGNDARLRELLLRRIVQPQAQKDLVLAENGENLLQLLARSFDWDGHLESSLLKTLQESHLTLIHLELKRLPATGEMALLKRIATGLYQNGPMLLLSGSETWLNAVVLIMEEVSPPPGRDKNKAGFPRRGRVLPQQLRPTCRWRQNPLDQRCPAPGL